MKKKFSILILVSSIFFVSCYTDSLDSLSTFEFQFMVNFDTDHYGKSVPDTSVTFSNLNEHSEYRDNKEKIQKAEILHFNYWIDSLVLEGNKVYNPDTDYVEFEFIRYYLQFAKPRPGFIPDEYDLNNPINLDPKNWIPDETSEKYLLGEFLNVDIKDYFRKSHHIIEVPEETAEAISEVVKNRPQFFIITEYSNTKGDNPNMTFPYIHARFDMDIRFEIEL